MESKIAVIGLGYVGLPLAVALAKSYVVVGYDISEHRVREIKEGYDRTNEIEETVLKKSSLQVSTDANSMLGCDVFIVTVPTPVDASNTPDLEPLRRALLLRAAWLFMRARFTRALPKIFVDQFWKKYLALKRALIFTWAIRQSALTPVIKSIPLKKLLRSLRPKHQILRKKLHKFMEK
jgi:threonine dehydrogenase-like Zn-dependent dehydrogenase